MYSTFCSPSNRQLVRTVFLLVLSFFCLSLSLLAQTNSNQLPSSKGIEFRGILGHVPHQEGLLMVKDVPHEQLLKDCKFYGGDSLAGFDFGAKTIQAEKEGNISYGEFLSFMFKEQSAFVKTKYSITTLPYEIVLAALSRNAKSSEIQNLDNVSAANDPCAF